MRSAAHLAFNAADAPFLCGPANPVPRWLPSAPPASIAFLQDEMGSGNPSGKRGCRHKRPHTFHRAALLWSNRHGVSGRMSTNSRAGRTDAGDIGPGTE